MACENCRSNKTKQRSEKEYKALINRLNRIEGQIRGIKGMLANHIKTCVAEDIRNGKDETIDDLVATLQKLMR